MAKSYHPATPENLALFKRLCEEAGQRYSPPRTDEQARSRIRDLRARRGTKAHAPPRTARRDLQDDARKLLRQLKIAHYECAKKAEQGRLPRGIRHSYEGRIRALENKLDRLLGADV